MENFILDVSDATMAASSSSMLEDFDDSRVVLHLDLDCFYCQVESQRLRLDPAAPLAVRQWQGLIAVNYAARKAGVTRHMTAAEALNICPRIALAHVETLGEGGASDGGSVVYGGGKQEQFVPQKSQRKASLLRYRDASARVLAALRSFFPPGTVVEKASIDEFYVDATAAAEGMLRPENGGCAAGVCEAAARAPGGAVVVEGFDEEGEEEKEKKEGGGEEGGSGREGSGKASSSSSSSSSSLDPTNPLDARLAAGAALASGARALVLRETGYTLSAGISHNKLLSKIASARFKPNRQAVVPRRGAAALLRALPLAKLPGFGGKLGAAVSAATGAETAGEVAALPFEVIKDALRGDGDASTALAVFRAVRGESRAAVVEKAAPKSLMAAKSLDAATSSRVVLEKWLAILSDELATRLEADGRPPRTLALHYRCRGVAGGSERSVSGPAPRAMRRTAGEGSSSSSVAVAVPPDASAIAAAAGVLLTRAMNAAAAAAAASGGGGAATASAAWPLCSRLSLVAGDFAPPRATGAASIASFFSSSAAASSPAKKKEKEEEQAEEEAAEDEEEEKAAAVVVVGEEKEEEEDDDGEGSRPPPPPRPVAAQAAPAAAQEDLLATVDVREQERILREIERGRAAGASAAPEGGRGGARGGGGGGRGGRGGGRKRDAASAALPPVDSRQRSIAAMFGRGKSGGGGSGGR